MVDQHLVCMQTSELYVLCFTFLITNDLAKQVHNDLASFFFWGGGGEEGYIHGPLDAHLFIFFQLSINSKFLFIAFYHIDWLERI